MVDDSIIVVGTCNIWERWMHIHMSRLLFFHYSGIALFRVLIYFLFSSFLSAYANAARSAHGSEENLIHWSFSPWDRNSLFCVKKKKKVLFLHILLTTDSLILLRIVGQHLLSCKTIAKKKENNQGIPLFEPWRSEDLIIARSQLAGPPPCSKMVESACAFLVPRAFNLNRIQTIGLSLDTLSQNDELLAFWVDIQPFKVSQNGAPAPPQSLPFLL